MPQNKYSIKNLLNSNMKDHIPSEKKSDIYQINCKKIYIGKTKSAVAAQVWKEEHTMDRKPVLLKQASDKLGKYPYKKTNKDCIINFENQII